MNKDLFVEKLGSVSPAVDPEFMDNVVTESLRCITFQHNQIGTLNLVIVMKELAELQKELSNAITGNGDPVSIIEELADTYIGLRYIQKIFGVSDEILARAVNVKLQEQNERNM